MEHQKNYKELVDKALEYIKEPSETCRKQVCVLAAKCVRERTAEVKRLDEKYPGQQFYENFISWTRCKNLEPHQENGEIFLVQTGLLKTKYNIWEFSPESLRDWKETALNRFIISSKGRILDLNKEITKTEKEIEKAEEELKNLIS